MLIMSGIDYSLAGIDIRQKFSFTKAHQTEIYDRIKQDARIFGAVIVSTCNRTELYLSCGDSVDVDPFTLLCSMTGEDTALYPHVTRQGDALFQHLCRLSCGAKSQIWGEDQIITQVKGSIVFARENNAADNMLEVLFRIAVTCAKKIKTVVKFSKSESSIARKALSVLQKHTDAGKNVLVIGNGEVGRLLAHTLVENGYKVTMTLRQYTHGEVLLPDGVAAAPYAGRYDCLGDFDILVSATLSPHYTIEKDKLQQLSHIPSIMLDLAVPRDLEASIADMEGVTLYDVDTIGKDIILQNHSSQLLEIDQIIEKYHGDFKKWRAYSKPKEFAGL